MTTEIAVPQSDMLTDDGTLALVQALEKAGALSPTRLMLTDDTMPYEQFEALGVFLGRVQDGSRWWIGDWLIFGEHVYQEKYAQAASLLGLTPGTLQNYAYVAGAVPYDRRRIGLPFSTHREVASLPANEQDEWLAKAEEEGMTRAQLAAAIRPPKAPDDAGRPNPGVSFESQAREIGFAILRDAVQDEGGQHWTVPHETIERLRALLHDN